MCGATSKSTPASRACASCSPRTSKNSVRSRRILPKGLREAAIAELHRVEGKAEIIDGRRPPHRRSFSPDAAFVVQPTTDDFVDGAPVFAVEVRSPDDFDVAAQYAMAEKRADYFAAGTLVVWDVDTVKEHVVRAYRASDPENPAFFLAASAPMPSPRFLAG